LVHSSPNIKKEVLNAGALQPVIGLLRYGHHREVQLYEVHKELYNFIYLLGSAPILLA
jgi:hypothetical protein